MAAAQVRLPGPEPVQAPVRAMPERETQSVLQVYRERTAWEAPTEVSGRRSALQAVRERQASVRGLQERSRRAVPDTQPEGPVSAPDTQAQEARAERVPDTRAQAADLVNAPYIRAQAARAVSAPFIQAQEARPVNAPDIQARAARAVSVPDMRAQAARPVNAPDIRARAARAVNAPDSPGTGLTEGRESQEAGRENGQGIQAKEKVPGRQPGIWGLVRLAAAHTAGPMPGRKTLAPVRAGIRLSEGTGAEQEAAGQPGKRRQRIRQQQRSSAAVS